MTFALCDANSFYCSAEACYRPDLRANGEFAPAVVLSNNDGCLVAVNAAAKRLGVEKFQPYFKAKALLEKTGTHVFSSNYAHYSAMSSSLMSTLASFASDSFVYSIDEIFLSFAGLNSIVHSFEEYGHKLRRTAWRECRIPISVGIADTLSLCKLANRYAKKRNGVYVIDSEEKRLECLKNTPIGDVWGVGRRLSSKLAMMSIHTAYDLSLMSPYEVKRLFNIELERIVRELNSEPCKTWHDQSEDKKQIMSSRSVSQRINTLEELTESLAFHTGIVAKNARAQHSAVSTFSVFAHSSPFDDDPVSAKRVVQLPYPTNNTLELTRIASQCAADMFIPNAAFYKLGAVALDLVSDKNRQSDLFAPPADDRLMNVMDKLNSTFGPNSLISASQGFEHSWQMKRDHLSPAYTTKLSDIPVVKC
ncbi:Y-family DNA polymerase [Vibrio mediterranei]|uniref:Y-family DNA polymerase n=1 Tax=Vibrio mediterranei TaxID=689 RepID=UPI00406910B5